MPLGHVYGGLDLKVPSYEGIPGSPSLLCNPDGGGIFAAQ